MLAIRNLDVRYGQALAVNRLTLDVDKGSWVAIIGPNGAGKTSTLQALAGLIRHGGTVHFEGEDISRLPAWDRRRLGFGYVPEGRQIFPQMTVEENLEVGGYACDGAALRRGMSHAFGLFPRLAERRGQMAATLSGGEQQMLALARALMSEPKLLIVDEISWGLMPLLVTQVFARLAELNRDGLTILQAEQNAHAVLRHAHHAYVMTAGELAFDGPSAEMIGDPRVLESYVGIG